MTCGAGLTCTGGNCVVDPASRWNVVLEDVTLPSTNYAGVAWDAFGGAPDPVVAVRVASDTATPMSQGGPDDVFTVTFGGTPVTTNVRASDLQTLLRFDVLDEDVSDFEFVGACLFPVVEATFTGSRQTVTCSIDAASMNSGFTLHFHLEQF